jgi:sec-independent protein translocase protein TatA
MNEIIRIPLAFNLGPWEIAVILFLALLLFGGKKLPGLAKDLGEGIREFRRSISGSTDETSVTTTQSVSEPAPAEKKTAAKKSKKKA